MNKSIAAALIALAFTAGNIAATNAGNLKQAPGQDRLQLRAQTQAPTAGGLKLTSKPFNATCVAGFHKYDEHKVMKAGVPVVQRFNCRTAWIECPNFPAYAQTWLDYEVQSQTTGNEGKRIRVKYICQGINPAG